MTRNEREAALNRDIDEMRHVAAVYDKASEQIEKLTAENKKLREFLHHAESRFDLLAGYGLPDESYFICYSAMKDIAKEARDTIRQELK